MQFDLGTLASLVAVVAIGALLSQLAAWVRYHLKVRKIPVAHDLGLWDRLFTGKARVEFATDFEGLSRRGLAKSKDAFRVQTDFGDMVILGGHYAEEMKDDRGLSTGEYTKMSVEVADFLKQKWTDSSEWHPIPLYQMLMGLVGRASVWAFLGPELANNERWIELNGQYTMVAIGAVHALRRWPRFLLPLVHHFEPKAKAARAVLAECKQIMEPILRKRAETNRVGKKRSDESSDALDWFEEVAASLGETYDPTVAQLTFAVAGMHSTVDHLCQILIDLRDKPEVVASLRLELIEAFTKNGWTQAALMQLKLMESVMKESQRMKPINRVINKRIVTEDRTLSNNVVLPRGAFVAVSGERMLNPSVYNDPERYDAYRFIKRAEADPEAARFTSYTAVTPDCVGFGYGKHSCPGRTYVAQEMKVILAHILLKYEMQFPEGYQPKGLNAGFDSLTDMMATCMVKRRKEEIALPA
ncbi:hypothetical protein Daus18300_007573 [Diaporthe australafricana]|uniref:Cytochrome P450 n=1 Tax=Diaporthe australafricana TaxID=127596 RepID=A0ABR3WLR7_9PEZI